MRFRVSWGRARSASGLDCKPLGVSELRWEGGSASHVVTHGAGVVPSSWPKERGCTDNSGHV
ncbi:hypothetical protein SCLCIDRAFT_596985 [Scleroderma citrinum Foug A]|uniref:Uncharacterized protein n=1 Tax=Scleroderma citrinum Foug A TaxID=1036808 RepID=A0A0C3AIV5_9AGAM|nr:hypothetical protein SCLCIDRAFT_596985 [Scleroderma citrinum Foug A]